MDQSRKNAFTQFLLSQYFIELRTLLYNADFVSVFKCFDQQTQHFCVVKAQKMTSRSDIHQREVEAMLKIDHPNVVKLYKWCWYDAGMGAFYMILILEYCELDLLKEIEYRKNAGLRYWQEDELWSLIYQLVDAFAYMQYFNIAHRDVKPQNIFLTSDKHPKVGDFGSSKEIYSYSSTFTGTPFFLSPILKVGLMNGQQTVTHNVFKSDVYSLGVTLLFVATLNPPALLDMRNLVQMTETAISNLQYSENLKYLLRCMLQEDENNRPGFIDVWNWLHPQPAVIEEEKVEPEKLEPSANPLVPQENQPGTEALGKSEAFGNDEQLVPGKPSNVFSSFQHKYHQKSGKTNTTKKIGKERDRCYLCSCFIF